MDPILPEVGLITQRADKSHASQVAKCGNPPRYPKFPGFDQTLSFGSANPGDTTDSISSALPMDAGGVG
jgi:hypothetical protein